MALYYIDAKNQDGEDVGLFVRADSPEQAFKFWKEWEFSDETMFQTNLSTEPAGFHGDDDLRIFEVPDTATNGIIPWHDADGIKVVAFAEEV